MKELESNLDEQMQVEAAQQDPAHFAGLYEKHFGRVYAYVAHRVRTREEAQDLTAEVFHRALAGIARFEWRGLPFSAWLIGIAGHVVSDRWQRTPNHEVATEELEEFGKEDGLERRAMLYELVDALPPDQHLVIIRRFIDQKPLREIAAELGRSEGAIKQLQLRALHNLRERMRNRYER